MIFWLRHENGLVFLEAERSTEWCGCYFNPSIQTSIVFVNSTRVVVKSEEYDNIRERCEHGTMYRATGFVFEWISVSAAAWRRLLKKSKKIKRQTSEIWARLCGSEKVVAVVMKQGV